MKFVIRDDDLNYFNSPEEIIHWYTPVFEKRIPVGFSVIPFVHSKSDAWLTTEAPVGEYKIRDNTKLVEYVKNNPLIEVLLHGYNHMTKNRVFEYRAQKGLLEKTITGKQELEQVFGKDISVFVPPHDAIGTSGIRAIEHAGLHILRGVGMKNFLFRFSYIHNIVKMIMHRLRFLSKKQVVAYPYVLSFGKHKEAYGHRIEKDKEYLLKGLKNAARENGVFVITTHLATMTEEERDKLLYIIEQAKNLGFSFVYPHQVFHG